MRHVFAVILLLGISPEVGALCVNVGVAKLRAEPSASAKVTWVVGRYMPLAELDRKGNWIKVKDVDGDVHWASAGDVTGRERCVVVKVNVANLRTGPSARSALSAIQSVDKYTAFKRLDSDADDWYRVEDETGSKYWISATHVWRATTVSRIGF